MVNTEQIVCWDHKKKAACFQEEKKYFYFVSEPFYILIGFLYKKKGNR